MAMGEILQGEAMIIRVLPTSPLASQVCFVAYTDVGRGTAFVFELIPDQPLRILYETCCYMQASRLAARCNSCRPCCLRRRGALLRSTPGFPISRSSHGYQIVYIFSLFVLSRRMSILALCFRAQ